MPLVVRYCAAGAQSKRRAGCAAAVLYSTVVVVVRAEVGAQTCAMGGMGAQRDDALLVREGAGGAQRVRRVCETGRRVGDGMVREVDGWTVLEDEMMDGIVE